MDDVRNKLQQAIASKQTREGRQAPARPAPPPPPRPASKAPSPAKKKAKKSARSKKKQPKNKKGSGGPGGLSQGFQKFARTVIDEFRNATSEISPRALLATAAESLQGLKSIVTPENRASDGGGGKEKSPSRPQQNGAPPRGAPHPTAPAARAADEKKPEQTPKTINNPALTPSLRGRSEKPSAGAAQQGAAPAGAEETEAPSRPEAGQGSVEFSPARVKRHSGGRKKRTEEDEISRLESEIETAGEAHKPADDAGPEKPPADRAESPSDLQAQNASKTPPGAQQGTEPSEEDRPESQESGGEKSKPRKPIRKQQKTQVKISKTEHAIRGFQALQIVLSNPIWAPMIIQSDAKPSALYSPRARFDELFSDPVFREGLRAASRLATTYVFAPEKMRFHAKTIEAVRSFVLDPGGNIKSYTEILSKAIPEETVKAALLLFKNPHVQHLLYSVGTRLGTFLPTIEILTRIYVGLRKKAHLTPGERLKIQQEVLLRYQRAPYTEGMAKKARSLALTYFTDYLVEYAMVLYKERFDKVPGGRDDVESYYRRHEVIKTHCCNLLDEWGVRIGLSSQGVKGRFVKTADQFIDEVFGRVPGES